MPKEPLQLAKRSVLKALLLVGLSVVICPGNIHSQDRLRPFSEAIGVKATADKFYDFEKWRFSVDPYSYEIDVTGKAQRQARNGRSSRFRLDLAGSERIARVYYAQYNGDLILLCEDETFDAGSGFVSRFDGRTLRQKWRAHIPGFNVANGLIEGNAAYLGAIGFAGKLNLDSGKFIWKHADFYRKYREDGAFNIFETPKIIGNEAIYVENQDLYRRRPNIIKFNKNSGKVIKVELN